MSFLSHIASDRRKSLDMVLICVLAETGPTNLRNFLRVAEKRKVRFWLVRRL